MTHEHCGREQVAFRCHTHVLAEGVPGAIHATTANLNGRGFYSRCQLPFHRKERLRCLVEVTPEGFDQTEDLCIWSVF
jgi:hypothetical protein